MIPQIKKILYATDLSESANHAFGYALSLALSNDAKISIITVYEKLTHNINIEMRSEDFKTAKIKLAEKINSQLVHFENKQNIEFDYKDMIDDIFVNYGLPEVEITELAKKENYDVIVMGTHGHGFLFSPLIGSTAKKVVKLSKVPVLVVRLPEKIEK
ncbi:MAG: universal stress protein [Desulfuromonadaceae bacterium]|nr:universal stress protein [Desulfuromonadaceae bacterium]